MSEHSHPSASASREPQSGDWLDGLLARDAADAAAEYIPDQGFTARVIDALPSAGALPAWRRPAVTALWLAAAALLAVTLPGAALEVAREAVRLFAAQPFSLSTIATLIAAVGLATWTGAALALRRD
jgi:hypothetical protein